MVEDVNVGEGASQAGDVQLPDPHHKLESTLAHNRVDLDLRPVGHPVSAPSQSEVVPRDVPIPSHSVRNQTPGKRLHGLQALRLEPEDGAHLAFVVNQTARGFVQRWPIGHLGERVVRVTAIRGTEDRRSQAMPAEVHDLPHQVQSLVVRRDGHIFQHHLQ